MVISLTEDLLLYRGIRIRYLPSIQDRLKEKSEISSHNCLASTWQKTQIN